MVLYEVWNACESIPDSPLDTTEAWDNSTQQDEQRPRVPQGASANILEILGLRLRGKTLPRLLALLLVCGTCYPQLPYISRFHFPKYASAQGSGDMG